MRRIWVTLLVVLTYSTGQAEESGALTLERLRLLATAAEAMRLRDDVYPPREEIDKLTILIVSISSTDITPKSWQRDFFVHYRLKTIPCALAWFTMMWELLTFRPSKSGEAHELDVATPQPLPHAG